MSLLSTLGLGGSSGGTTTSAWIYAGLTAVGLLVVTLVGRSHFGGTPDTLSRGGFMSVSRAGGYDDSDDDFSLAESDMFQPSNPSVSSGYKDRQKTTTFKIGDTVYGKDKCGTMRQATIVDKLWTGSGAHRLQKVNETKRFMWKLKYKVFKFPDGSTYKNEKFDRDETQFSKKKPASYTSASTGPPKPDDSCKYEKKPPMRPPPSTTTDESGENQDPTATGKEGDAPDDGAFTYDGKVSSFFAKYKWWVIGGGIGAFVLLLVCIIACCCCCGQNDPVMVMPGPMRGPDMC